MGMTIFYSGMFNKKLSLKEMILEVKEFAKINQWQVVTFEDEFPKSAGDDSSRYGLLVTPPDSEPVHLHFDSAGRLGFEMDFLVREDEDSHIKTHNGFNSNCVAFTKTQYAGPEVHMKVVELLKKISTKFLHQFEVYDDGGYWTTGDEQHLRDCFNSYNLVFATMKESLEKEGLKVNWGANMNFK